MWQQRGGRQHCLCQFPLVFQKLKLLQGKRIAQVERAGTGADEFVNVRAAAQYHTRVMRDGTNIGACRATDRNTGTVACHVFHNQFMDPDLHRGEIHCNIPAGQLVGGHAVDFFR